eukprot:jgi/Chlat1/603/Chrsp103S08589
MSGFQEVLHTVPLPVAIAVSAVVLTVAVLAWRSSSSRSTPPMQMATMEPEPPVVLRDVTSEELAEHNGTGGTAVWVAIKGNVYDVTKGSAFYGPGGPYEMFAGKDASRALAKMAFSAEYLTTRVPELDDLSYSEKETLDQWEMKFDMKYTKLGRIVSEAPAGSQ